MSSVQSKLRCLGDNAQQLVHLLYPLKRDRTEPDVNKIKVTRFQAFVSLFKLHFKVLFGQSFSVFDIAQTDKCCVLLLSGTVNQSMALEPLRRSLQRAEVRVMWSDKKRNYRPASRFQQSQIFILALRNIFRHDFLRHQDSFGIARLYFFLSEVAFLSDVLEEIIPTSIVISNDHTPSIMAVQYAAHLAEIPVDYVQHAHVTNVFPEPRYLRHLFTDGEVATQVYSNLTPPGSDVQAYPFGPVRFEQAYFAKLKLGEDKRRRRIGLALDFDCSMLCNRSLQNLVNSGEKSVNVRFHPRTKPTTSRRVVDTLISLGFDVDVFSQAGPGEFLLQSMLIFGGDSSIILDAALFGCIPFIVSSQKSDYYGFIRSGLSYHLKVVPHQLEECELDRGAQLRNQALAQYVNSDFLKGSLPLPSERIAEVISRSNQG